MDIIDIIDLKDGHHRHNRFQRWIADFLKGTIESLPQPLIFMSLYLCNRIWWKSFVFKTKMIWSTKFIVWNILRSRTLDCKQRKETQSLWQRLNSFGYFWFRQPKKNTKNLFLLSRVSICNVCDDMCEILFLVE